METIAIRDLPQYVKEIDALMRSWELPPGDVWFRGVSSLKYRPVPGLIWREVENDDEQALVELFLHSYKPLVDDPMVRSWDLYALMQHYGLPTRLLDWTLSPLMALYFALEHEPKSRGTRVVWAINPFQLNELSLEIPDVPVPGHTDPTLRYRVDSYLPPPLQAGNRAALPQYPLAISSPLTNRRILAQQGCFTVHGKSTSSISSYYTDKHMSTPMIRRFTIQGVTRRNELLWSLYNLGVKEDTVYQDLPSLSRRVVRSRSLIV